MPLPVKRLSLSSTRLAFILIALLTALIILSALIPQRDTAVGQITDLKETLGSGYALVEWLKLDGIYTAPYFFILLGLLAVNLAAGNIKRFRLVYKTDRTLLRARHLGSMLFHFSLLMIMGGVILTYLFRSVTVFSLTEQQTLSDTASDFHRQFSGPLYANQQGRFRLKLDSLVASYQVGQNSTIAAGISLLPAGVDTSVSAMVYTGHSLNWRQLEFHIGAQTGYSTRLILRDSTGRRLFGDFLRLATAKVGDSSIYRDFLVVPGADFRVGVEVFPDSADNDSTRFKIVVETGTGVVFDSIVQRGEQILFEGYTLTIPEVRQWCYIEVVQTPYLGLVFFGFWSALAGMVIGLAGRLAMTGKRQVS